MALNRLANDQVKQFLSKLNTDIVHLKNSEWKMLKYVRY